MRISARRLVAVLTMTWASFTPMFASTNVLFSPWDTRVVEATDKPYGCGLPRQIAPYLTILNREYRTGMTAASEDAKDAADAESVNALDDLETRVVKAADYFQATGSAEAARCVVTLLSAASADHAMTVGFDTAPAFYQQTSKLRAVTVALLKVRNAGMATPDQLKQILDWMETLARQERVFYDFPCRKQPCKADNQEALQAAYAVASVGIAANDRDLFYWGVGKYRKAAKLVGPQGMLESVRASDKMLKFNLEAAAAMVLLAEYGELNGEHLYDYNHGAIHMLVHTTTRGLVDPTPFTRASGGKAQVLPDTIEGWQIAWATMYVVRFPDPVIEALLKQRSDKGLTTWGGEPFMPSPAKVAAASGR